MKMIKEAPRKSSYKKGTLYDTPKRRDKAIEYIEKYLQNDLLK